MPNTFPFYYEVRFRLISYDSDNNFNIQSYIEKCENKDPLIARKKAFEIFNDYLSFPAQKGRVIKDQRGNYKIVKPTFVNELLQQMEIESRLQIKNQNDIQKKTLLEMALDSTSFNLKILEESEKFKEEISIFIVIKDLEILKAVSDWPFYDRLDDEVINKEFEIHKVASYDFEEQYIIDDLEMIELALYKHFNIDVSKLKKTVHHYGLDYAESGEDEEGGAQREILETPQIWSTYENYIESEDYIRPSEIEDTDDTDFNYIDIIKKGESHQIEFKPTLSYNFNTEKGGISVLYIIAKAICGFLNSSGGILFIGVKDSGEIQGIDYDYSLYEGKNGRDKILLEVDSLISRFFGISQKPLITANVERLEDKDVLVIVVEKSSKPVLLLNRRNDLLTKEMYIRMNASTHQLTDMEELIEYLMNNWKE